MKRFPRGVESHRKTCESKVSFSVQKHYEAQFSFESLGRFNIKNPKLPHARLLGRDLADERLMWMSTLVHPSLSVTPQGRSNGRWMSMRAERINRMLSSAIWTLFYADWEKWWMSPAKLQKLFGALNEVLPRYWTSCTRRLFLFIPKAT